MFRITLDDNSNVSSYTDGSMACYTQITVNARMPSLLLINFENQNPDDRYAAIVIVIVKVLLCLSRRQCSCYGRTCHSNNSVVLQILFYRLHEGDRVCRDFFTFIYLLISMWTSFFLFFQLCSALGELVSQLHA